MIALTIVGEAIAKTYWIVYVDHERRTAEFRMLCTMARTARSEG